MKGVKRETSQLYHQKKKKKKGGNFFIHIQTNRDSIAKFVSYASFEKPIYTLMMLSH